MSKKLGIVLLSMLVILSLFSVVSAETVREPDTIVHITIGDQNTLDPHFSYDTGSSELIYQVYEGLIAYKGSSVTEFEPLLATEVPSIVNGLISEDGLTYTFPIREGVKFSNGNPLTPEDVKYSFLRGLIQDRSGGPVWMLHEPITGKGGLSAVTKEVVGVDNPKELTEEQSAKVYAELEKHIEIDGNNVIFHLAQPYPPFLNIIAQGASWGSILDKEWTIAQGDWDGEPTSIAKYYDPTKENDPLYDKMMGTGPFILVEWVNGDHVIFQRNDDYWRTPANFKTVIIKNIDEWSTRKLMLQRGDADIVYVPNQYMDQVRELEGVKITEGIATLQNMVGIMNWDIDVKGNEAVGSAKLDGKGIPADFFNDIHVRKAFSYAFNYEAFISQVRMGNSIQARGPIVSPLLGYDENSSVYTFDLDKATEEFKLAFDGEVWDKGFEMTILYNTGNDARKTACDILKTYVESINPKFNIRVRGVQWSTYLDNLVGGKMSLGFIGWLADFPDPHNFVQPYLDSAGAYGAFKGDEYIKWAQENVEPLINKGISITDPVEREKIYKELQNLSIEYATDLWLDQPTGNRVERSWVKGWYPNAMRPGQDFYILDK
jgi:peptide/nickel transport system substrate-binding protein